jgi:GNAT superfamily N-acetyltransferase
VDLLNRACGELAAQGRTLAVGPIDGNTWQRYRFITERGDEPRFFLEPDNPDEWPGYFRQAGFTPLAEYHSALNTDLKVKDERIAQTRQSLREEGITLRTLDMNHFEKELRRLHALSLVGFRDNFLYTPISEEEFLTQYRSIRPHVRPEFVILAEKVSRLVGFIFAIPDLYQAARGVRIDTAIVKTMAVHPDHAGKGLGGLLMDLVHQAIHQAGYARAIHALMHADNRSGLISKHTARTFRRYTLFAKPIGQP